MARGDLRAGTPVKNLHCKLRPNGWNGYCRRPFRNSVTPYPTVPSPTPYEFPFPKITCSQRCRLVPVTNVLYLVYKNSDEKSCRWHWFTECGTCLPDFLPPDFPSPVFKFVAAFGRVQLITFTSVTDGATFIIKIMVTEIVIEAFLLFEFTTTLLTPGVTLWASCLTLRTLDLSMAFVSAVTDIPNKCHLTAN